MRTVFPKRRNIIIAISTVIIQDIVFVNFVKLINSVEVLLHVWKLRVPSTDSVEKSWKMGMSTEEREGRRAPGRVAS